MRTTFERRIVRLETGWKGFDHADIERHLDELGGQGWEAVSTQHLVVHHAEPGTESVGALRLPGTLAATRRAH